MDFQSYSLTEWIVIKKLISFHYHELSRGFLFSGEEHDFWELCYIDKGEAEVFAYNRAFQMKQGDILLLTPNMFHSMKTLNDIAPNLVNISFDCGSSYMAFFENRSFRLTDQERNLLSEVVNEGLHAFDPPIDSTSPNDHTLRTKDNAPFGSEQLIKVGLEKMLIMLIRRHSHPRKQEKLTSASKENWNDELFGQITDYLKDHLSLEFKLEELSIRFQIGKSQLKKLFKDKVDIGIKQYWSLLKLEHAKIMIREEKCNVTQIAEILGFGSVHYFSRQFKKEMDMTPTEYAKTVKARFSDSL
jgi:AraC-like DNA-binding protein